MPNRIWGLAAALAATASLLPIASIAGAVSAQETGSLQGNVFDATTLDPLEGVTVSILGADGEVTTDALGTFTFSEVPAGSRQIRLRRPGYTSSVEDIRIAAGDRTYVQLSVIELSAVLDELLIRGERPERRMDEVRGGHEAAQTAADLLAARLPGVNLSKGSGNVGSAGALRIRGISSIQLSNLPLIILDGVRLSLSSGGGGIELQVLDQIPASQVESIRVLKGPATAVRYSESANGVIEIVTHRGGPSDR